MPETPSPDARRTSDPVATTDEPLAVPDCAGGLRTPAGQTTVSGALFPISGRRRSTLPDLEPL